MIYQNPRLGRQTTDFSAGGNIAEKIIMSGCKNYERDTKWGIIFLRAY